MFPNPGRSDFIYTKNSARPRSDFLYTKNYMKSSGGDLVENGCFLKVKLANVGRIFGFFNEGRKSSRGDLAENGCFLKVTFANVCGFSDCLMEV